ncbi:MAG: hypothetical protein ACK4FF_03930, partial [Limnobacter sp.]|uniref:hypothetical protein n=1 Tax=Limnobacter sp. TaxID=2003368 RepID=UPI00391C3CC1
HLTASFLVSRCIVSCSREARLCTHSQNLSNTFRQKNENNWLERRSKQQNPIFLNGLRKENFLQVFWSTRAQHNPLNTNCPNAHTKTAPIRLWNTQKVPFGSPTPRGIDATAQ